MNDSKSRDLRIIGIGQLGISIAAFFYDTFLTTGIDYNRETFKSQKIDNGIMIKNFDFSLSERMDGIVQVEKETILSNIKSPIVFIIGQTEGKFQETVTPLIIKTLKASGTFIGYFPILPLGVDKKAQLERIKAIVNFVDVLDIIDSDQLLNRSKNERVVDMNNIFFKAIEGKVLAVLRIITNSTVLGISIRDIKMMTEMYGPIYIKVLSYPFQNFNVIERDFFDHLNTLDLKKIKRLHLVFEIGDDVDAGETISFLKSVKNKLNDLDVRSGFVHTKGNFGLIILHFGNMWSS
ncbi:MAG: hypothetical protein M1515_00880 [Candidatus Thermoplasmatota archaeon]|jgi:hypothetical protein|nr:hypothetical protein [Candidatus Thermoplasmatota archaeon]